MKRKGTGTRCRIIIQEINCLEIVTAADEMKSQGMGVAGI